MFGQIITVLRNWKLMKRILITLGILLIFRLGATITVPGAHMNAAVSGQMSGFIGLLNTLGGGAIKRFSILALGVSPYITASIIIQLLSSDVIPYLTRLSKGGEKGRVKIDKITRYVTLCLAVIQGIALSYALTNGVGGTANFSIKGMFGSQLWLTYAFIITTLAGGSMLTLWLADQITIKGVGNGVSLIIFSGIVAQLPVKFKGAFSHFVDVDGSHSAMLVDSLKFGSYVFLFLFLIFLIAFIYQSERHIPIQQTGKGLNLNHEKIPYLPIKVNSAGVIPVIFASSILMIPLTVAQFFSSSHVWVEFINTHLQFTNWLGLLLYSTLILLFTFFYAHVVINSDQISENFQKSGTFIPGIRQGKQTQQYITRVVTILSILGALFLTLIAALPYLQTSLFQVNRQVAIGGTGVIIVVGVAVETINQIRGRLITNKYSAVKKQQDKKTVEHNIW